MACKHSGARDFAFSGRSGRDRSRWVPSTSSRRRSRAKIAIIAGSPPPFMRTIISSRGADRHECRRKGAINSWSVCRREGRVDGCAQIDHVLADDRLDPLRTWLLGGLILRKTKNMPCQHHRHGLVTRDVGGLLVRSVRHHSSSSRSGSSRKGQREYPRTCRFSALLHDT